MCPRAPPAPDPRGLVRAELVAIGASLGGPRALATLLRAWRERMAGSHVQRKKK